MKNFKQSVFVANTLILSACVLAAQGHAATNNSDENIEQAVKKKPFEEITVTGHRYPTRRENVAGSVSLISSEEITSIQARNIADILANQPGVDVEGDTRYGIRSINVRGLSGNYVKIKVDNVDQPSEFDGGTFVSSSRIDVDVDMIKRIEVIKGPASSTQGSEAIGGSVLFSTIDPENILKTQGNETSSWFKSDWHSLDHGQSYSMAIANRHNNTESLLAYTNRRSNEADSFGEVSDQEIQRNNVLGKFIYHLTDSQSLHLTGELSKSESDGSPIEPDRYDDFYFTEDVSQRVRGGIAHQWNADSILFDHSLVQLDWQEKSQESNSFRKALAGSAENKDYAYDEDSLQLELQLTKSISVGDSGIQHNLAYGLNFKKTDHENINITWYDDNNDGVINDRSRQYLYIPSADVEASGAYIQDEIILANGRLRVSPGIRYDRFSVDPQALELDLGDELVGFSPSNTYEGFSDAEITGRLGLVFALNDTTRIFSQYSQGFKAPDFRQLYYSWSNDLHGYKSEPNPDLNAEYSDSIEIGLRKTSEHFDWEIAAFSSQYDDFIERVSEFTDPSFPNGITRFENISEAKIKGVELSSRLSLATIGAPEGTSARLSMSYSEGEDDTGVALESVNPWSANLRLAYDAPSYRWGTALRFNYAASVERNDVVQRNTQYLPENYLSIDADFFWLPTESLTLRAGINNLTDKQYERWSNVRGLSDADFADRYSQPGRNWAVTAKYQM